MTSQVRAALEAVGIQHVELEVDSTQHTIKVSIGRGDDGWAAAQALFACLPVGVLTLGTEMYAVPDGYGSFVQVNLSRAEVGEECYDIRGRVPQPLAEGWERAEPTQDLLDSLGGAGVVGWDLHKQGEQARLFVDHKAIQDRAEAAAREFRSALLPVSLFFFEFNQPRPKDDTYITVRTCSNLLSLDPSDVYVAIQPRLGFLHLLGEGYALMPGPCHMTVDLESFGRFLISRGFSIKGAPDPLGYSQSRAEAVSWNLTQGQVEALRQADSSVWAWNRKHFGHP